MARGRFPHLLPFGIASYALGLTLTLGACGSDGNDGGGGTSGSNSGGQTGGSQSNTGGLSPIAGQSTTGGTSPIAGTSAGGSSNGGTATGGTSSGGTPSGGGGTGGSVSAGAPSGGTAGAGGSPPSGTCTRELLDGLLDDYFEALSAGDPSSLPVSTTLKFTENAQVSQLGMTDFWKNAGDTKYSQRALDTTACSVAAQAVIPENGTDLPVGIRIKVVDGKMTEIETIVVRQGDYTASFAVDSNPAAIIDIADEVGWHDEVPEAQRATRQQLTSWMDKYFRAFPSGVCNVTSACRRLENGGGNFSCGTGASCTMNTPSTPVFSPRVIIVDEVRGISAGFTIFDFQTTGHLDMHMMKMSNGQVHAVHAMLRNTNGMSGWE